MATHGTYSSYSLAGCQCTPCLEAGATYRGNRRRAIAYGTWQPFMDAEPVRRHVKALQAHGLGIRQIAAVSGVNRSQIEAIAHGRGGRPPSQRVRPTNAQRILAVRPTFDNLAPAAFVGSVGSHRRLKALVYCGWTQAKLAEHLGMTKKNFWTLMQAQRITVAKAITIRDLYDRLWNRPPPEHTQHHRAAATRARRYARAQGFAPPLAWDEEAIDDPAAVPELGEKVPRTVALLENFEELTALGYTSDQAAERLEVSRDYLLELRRRARVRERVAA